MRRSSFALVTLLSATALPSVAIAQSAPQTDGIDSSVGDIVVTAQKREQRLQDVPVAVTALTSESLQANRIVNVTDISAVVPNLTVSVSPGGTQSPVFVMRGEYGSAGVPGADKGIALYVDGVYLGNSQASIFDVADIERIEVLRGPQGTLFGRNSTGGAISIITRQPTGKLGVRQQFTYGNYNQLRSQTRVDLPQFGPFSALVAYTHSQRHGEVKNLAAGTLLDFGPATGGALGKVASPKRFGDDNTESVSAALKADFVDNLALTYKFDYSQSDFTTTAQGGLFDGEIPSFLALIRPRFPAGTTFNLPPANLRTPISKTRPDAVNNSFTLPGSTKVYGHNLTGTLTLSDAVSVQNILAYRRSKYYAPGADLSGFGGVTATIPGVGTVPFIVLGSSSQGGEKAWSNETQLNIDTDWFHTTAGVIYYKQKILRAPIGTAIYTTSARPLVGGAVPFDPRIGATRINVDSKAAFVQHEQHLTSTIDLILGMRLTKDRKNGVDNTTIGQVLPIVYRDSRPTYLASINYKPNSDQLYYIKYGTGFISGGTIGGIAFTPETAKSYEAGMKLDLFGRIVRANFAVFDVKYDGLQQPASGSTAGVAANSVIINIGSAHAKGVEAELTVRPSRAIMLSGNLGYTDFALTSLTPIATRIGASLEYVRPAVTANLAAQFTSEPVVGDAHLMARVDARFKSKFTSVLSACGLACSVNPTPQQAILDATNAPSSWVVNGRVALQGIAIGSAKAEIAAWGRNIFDNGNIGFGTAFGFTYSATYERARTYGLDLTIEF